MCIFCSAWVSGKFFFFFHPSLYRWGSGDTARWDDLASTWIRNPGFLTPQCGTFFIVPYSQCQAFQVRLQLKPLTFLSSSCLPLPLGYWDTKGVTLCLWECSSSDQGSCLLLGCSLGVAPISASHSWTCAAERKSSLMLLRYLWNLPSPDPISW